MSGKPDQLPACSEAVHHHDHAERQQLRRAREVTVEKADDVVGYVSRKAFDAARQLFGESGKAVARHQHGGDRAHVVDGAWRADLQRQAAKRTVIILDLIEGCLHARCGGILEVASELAGGRGIVGDERVLDHVRIGVGFRLHHEVADPLPDRIEHGARDAPLMLVLGGIVDQEGIERTEEQARRRTYARRALADLAQRPAQFVEHELGTGIVVAAQESALKLRNEERACLGFEFEQIFPQPFDGQPLTEHPGSAWLVSDAFC
jgi:hypothetical protein